MDQASLAYSYSQEAVSAAVVDQLKRTRVWVLFFAIILWIVTILLFLGGLSMLGLGIFASASGRSSDSLSPEVAAMGGIVGVGFFYLVIAPLHLYPAVKLSKFASRIRALAGVPSERNLVTALNEQRAFWKYVSILMITVLILNLVVIGLAFAFGLMGAASAGN